MNREEWLTRLATEHLWPYLQTHGAIVPKAWRVSLGFPKGSRGGRHSIGQCWDARVSADQHIEMFISPELSSFDATATLIHEMIHACVGLKCGHKGAFRIMAIAAGLTGKMTATVPGDALKPTIAAWLGRMPAYPHAQMCPSDAGKPKPGSRLVKVFCPECDYVMRITQKWIDVAIPCCPNEDCARHTELMSTETV